MNDGLRPHYDFDFDEAIQRNIEGNKLDPEHETALRKFTNVTTEPNELATGQELVILK